MFLIYFGSFFFYSSPSLSGIKYLQTFIAHTTGNLQLASESRTNVKINIQLRDRMTHMEKECSGQQKLCS